MRVMEFWGFYGLLGLIAAPIYVIVEGGSQDSLWIAAGAATLSLIMVGAAVWARRADANLERVLRACWADGCEVDAVSEFQGRNGTWVGVCERHRDVVADANPTAVWRNL